MGSTKRLLQSRAKAQIGLQDIPGLRYPNPYPPRLRKWPAAVAAGKLRLNVGPGRRGLVPRVIGVRQRRPAGIGN